MVQEPKAKLKNSKPGHGMKLHKYIATGGNPKQFKGAVANAVATRGNKK